ncbi:excalibur calcium-binding domain-containing protein [Actinocatenispora rupis]|uniref:excalibur calcium-binding domain-containing protein n=1 Tax=Actinocatenispora rupis TaxID=519421 RepID=UPI0019440247|nr:excalibur calcium-binding domain-containing protein [Actinocatenispora rupis]
MSGSSHPPAPPKPLLSTGVIVVIVCCAAAVVYGGIFGLLAVVGGPGQPAARALDVASGHPVPAPSVARTSGAARPSVAPTTGLPATSVAAAPPTRPYGTRAVPRRTGTPSEAGRWPRRYPRDPRFRTCRQANAHGYGPYHRGRDPEYWWYRDHDRDGVDCDDR